MNTIARSFKKKKKDKKNLYLELLVHTAISQHQEQTPVYTMSNSIISCYIKWVFNFSRKVLNSKASGPYSQLQLSIMLDLDNTFPQHIIMRCKKKLECTQRLVWMKRNFIIFQLVRSVRSLFQFNDPWILYTSINHWNST